MIEPGRERLSPFRRQVDFPLERPRIGGAFPKRGALLGHHRRGQSGSGALRIGMVQVQQVADLMIL
jgi:hypothetical protein